MYDILHMYGILQIRKRSCVIRCVLWLEWQILLTLVWQDHIARTFLSVDIYQSMIFNKKKFNVTNHTILQPRNSKLFDMKNHSLT